MINHDAKHASWLQTCLAKQPKTGPFILSIHYNTAAKAEPLISERFPASESLAGDVSLTFVPLIAQDKIADALAGLFSAALKTAQPVPTTNSPWSITILCLAPSDDFTALSCFLRDALLLLERNPNLAVVSVQAAMGQSGFLSQKHADDRLSSWEQSCLAAFQNDSIKFEPAPIKFFDRSPIKHFELLTRLETHDGQILTAGEFLADCHHDMVFRELDIAAIRRLSQILPELLDRHVSINVERQSLRNERWWQAIEGALVTYPAFRRSVTLEITEREQSVSISGQKQAFAKLHDMGLTIAIDDLGTGVTTLNELNSQHVKIVKFDRSLVRRALKDPMARICVDCLCAVLHASGFMMIAEGIELSEDEQFCRNLGFSGGQGFLYSPQDAGYL